MIEREIHLKVKDLIKQLEEYDPNLMVVMSGDPEGNDFYPLEAMAEYVYDEDDKSIRGINDYDYFVDDPDGIPALVLWP